MDLKTTPTEMGSSCEIYKKKKIHAPKPNPKYDSKLSLHLRLLLRANKWRWLLGAGARVSVAAHRRARVWIQLILEKTLHLLLLLATRVASARRRLKTK